MLCGPATGSALLLGLGESWGIWANVLIYLPLTIWLLVVPYTGHLRDATGVRRPPMTFSDAVKVLREVADNPTLISMVAPPDKRGRVVGSTTCRAAARGPAAASRWACWAASSGCTGRSRRAR